MKSGLGLVSFAAFVLAFVMVMAIGASAQPGKPTPAPCFNGVQDEGEGGVDCGGNCAYAQHFELCDGKDNDVDCLVDEGCPSSLSQQNEAEGSGEIEQSSCHDGIQNGLEGGIDCGGECLSLNTAEICDGIDNDKDCVIDNVPYINCSKSAEQTGQSLYQPEPGKLSEQIGTPAEQPGVPASYPDSTNSLDIPVEGTPAELIPATPAPTLEDIAALTDEELGAFMEQKDGGAFLKEMRKLAQGSGVYVPKDESDVQFGRKFLQFLFKHSEFVSFEKEPTEEDFVKILRDFSEETYPKPVQPQSFISKVAGFFKRLFG